MATPFELFVNAELPKRIATNSDPTSVPAGKVPVTTGIGLLVEFLPYLAGSTDLQSIIDLIDTHLVVNEIPNINGLVCTTQYTFIANKLKVYCNGIRLCPGIDNDYVVNDDSSFTLIYADIDSILVDYHRSYKD